MVFAGSALLEQYFAFVIEHKNGDCPVPQSVSVSGHLLHSQKPSAQVEQVAAALVHQDDKVWLHI
jgi:hypothetical protein